MQKLKGTLSFQLISVGVPFSEEVLDSQGRSVHSVLPVYPPVRYGNHFFYFVFDVLTFFNCKQPKIIAK